MGSLALTRRQIAIANADKQYKKWSEARESDDGLSFEDWLMKNLLVEK